MPHLNPLRLLGLLGGLACAVATGAEAPSSADRGRLLYEQGIGAGGRRLSAATGAEQVLLPPTFSACLNCHGADGRGRTEGGVIVPPIAWEQLDNPYGVTTPGGRRRVAYDEVTFHVALTRGVDPSGHTLAPAMPRYSLTPQESSDLAAYLRQIGERVIPGVSDDAILIGWRAPVGASATVAASVLEAWCAEINATGGIFQRRVRAVALGDGAQPAFAVLSIGEGRADSSAALALARSGVPVLIAGRAPGEERGHERCLFALLPADAAPHGAAEMPPKSVEYYLGFARRHSLSADERELQLALLASARVILEALKNTGRELDREKFLTALEALSGVETGFTPPASFTPRRHVATSGVYAIPAHLFSPP
jgi:hypothetical protein